MNTVRLKKGEGSIFFVTTDVKRAIGADDIIPNFHIICSYLDPIIPVLRKQGARIFCLEEKIGQKADGVNNSGKLLENSLVDEYISINSKEVPWILYFKPSLKLDLVMKKKGYRAIGNSAVINEQFENKLLFYSIVKSELPQYTVPSCTGKISVLEFDRIARELGLPFVVQFGHGWAGKTTFFIESKDSFNDLKEKFPNTHVRISRKIDGITILNNCCMYQSEVFMSPPAIQLNGITQLHKNPSVTCGRQWPSKFITVKQKKTIVDMTKTVAKLMRLHGFKGFFGLDFLIDSSNGRVYVSECNARLTASVPFYTRLEQGLKITPLLIFHIAEFMKLPLTHDYYDTDIPILGSQIIFRSGTIIPHIVPPDGFGVYKIHTRTPLYHRKEYYPEKLQSNEFIFMKNIREDSEELARIEMKQEVLDAPDRLKPWVADLWET